jgi:hypothetical protein
MLQAEVVSGYQPKRPTPAQPRALGTAELLAMFAFEIISWLLPLRILSSTTADADLEQSSFGVSIAVDLVRALFWFIMSVRLSGGISAALVLSVKYDILMGRAILLYARISRVFLFHATMPNW